MESDSADDVFQRQNEKGQIQQAKPEELVFIALDGQLREIKFSSDDDQVFIEPGVYVAYRKNSSRQVHTVPWRRVERIKHIFPGGKD